MQAPGANFGVPGSFTLTQSSVQARTLPSGPDAPSRGKGEHDHARAPGFPWAVPTPLPPPDSAPAPQGRSVLVATFPGGANATFPAASLAIGVTAGIIFNVTAATSAAAVPPPPSASSPPSGAAKRGLSPLQRSAVIGGSVAGGLLVTGLCAAMAFLIRRERQGEPVFSRLEDVVSPGPKGGGPPMMEMADALGWPRAVAAKILPSAH